MANQQTDSYYDSIAPGYNNLYAAEQQEKLAIAWQYVPSHLRESKKTKLLDVGCGTGISTDYWVDNFKWLCVGVDPSQGLLSQNKTHKSSLSVASAEKLPFGDKVFDIVVSFTAIQNFSNVEAGLLEMKRVGKGFFLFSVLAGAVEFTKIETLIGKHFKCTHKVSARNDVLFVCELA